MRAILIVLVAVGAWFLPRAPGAQPVLRVDPNARCTSAPSYPAVIERVVLPAGRAFGDLQFARTPLGPHTIAITIDDGPDPKGSRAMMSILEARCLRATFFYVGQYAALRPDLVREAVRRGHNVGSHSWSHPTRLAAWSQDAARGEIQHGFDAVEAAAPHQIEPFFRFPGLGNSQALRQWLTDKGVATIGAEAGSDDWRGLGPEAITQHTLAAMTESDGGILIIHETHPAMVAALPGVLDELHRRGFKFVQITAGPDQRRLAEAQPDRLL